ncbi:hypothetical protein A3D03_02475 [Candidatus Gottesmanbacteria bacterium RIFCSPHIGHO2_02_FULL_40_13]|uniref:Glycosyltransferase RgtA/B/C/D-like domain-containing protein n=1 Tax=Candidatus Gottesmanbacteria bacterium RIFCSPHIGHO2_02_FULL_40_13 TaxID=1798384 RepID=A0A1F6AA42_9BACT|nr:MAG: hypothetical protein A3D03_02475 [Candidatus Gottesmanbacteria bacterium RIFCSPHIGHO2_02_FULL_40_13]
MKFSPYRIISFGYIFCLLALVIYSYTQIDLNLTLSGNLIYQQVQGQLIFLGYFQRHLSALIYSLIQLIMFGLYFYLMRQVLSHRLNLQQIVKLILLVSVIAILSYPALSHDIFNYMFDARIVTKYHLNPYFFKANDFPGDLWVRFMHWTHRYYPYGPIWLILTLPFSYLGFGKFVLTLMNFKLMFFLFHLGNLYLINKITQKLYPEDRLTSLVFYGLNPLIISESLVSPHNEVMMLFFALAALYWGALQNSRMKYIILMILSAGVKFITIALLPLILFKKHINDKSVLEFMIKSSLILTVLFISLEIYYREAYPWYFIIFIGFSSLLIKYKKLLVFTFILSLSALGRYVPFLYEGVYSDNLQRTKNIIFYLPIIVCLIYYIFSLRRLKQ